MKYDVNKSLMILLMILFTLPLCCSKMSAQEKDSTIVTVSIQSLTDELNKNRQDLSNLVQNIETAKRQQDYLQGIIDYQTKKIQEYQEQAKRDTLSARSHPKTKKKE